MPLLDRPQSFDEELMADWSLWVLENGLIELPATVVRGESVPVARWAVGAFGAVMHVQWMWSKEEPEHGELVSEIELFHHEGGEWVPFDSTGGGGWPHWPFALPETTSKTGVWGMHCSFERGRCGCAMYGVVGSGASQLKVSAEHATTSMPVESPLGAFVVAFDGERPAVIRILDGNGSVIVTERFEPQDVGRTTGG